jgi:hypothetical protein
VLVAFFTTALGFFTTELAENCLRATEDYNFLGEQ